MSPPIEGRNLFLGDDVDLASDARKHYYKELVSFAREELLGVPHGYLQHLKTLFFEGVVSVDPWVAFRASAPLLICLSAPSSNRDFFINTFDAYEPRCAQYDLQLYVAHIFGRSQQQWPQIVERFEFIIESLTNSGLKCNLSEDGGLRPQYLSLYFKIFYLYRRGGDIGSCFVQNIIEYVEGDFERIQALDASGETLLALPKAFSPILSGEVANPGIVYADPILLDFLQRFFTKKLPPTLQAIVEGVYAQLERPIKFVDGRVQY